MNVYIRKDTAYYFPIIYVLKVIEKNREIKFHFLDNPNDSKITWDHENENSQVIAIDFYNCFNSDFESLKHKNVFTSSPNILDNNGKIDAIATIFYMINSLQELEPDDADLDGLGRFKYSSSYQSRFNNVKDNLVENIINDFYNDLYIEQPEYAIVNIGIESPPEYFQYILDEYYIEVYVDSKFKVFKKNKLINS